MILGLASLVEILDSLELGESGISTRQGLASRVQLTTRIPESRMKIRPDSRLDGQSRNVRALISYALIVFAIDK